MDSRSGHEALDRAMGARCTLPDMSDKILAQYGEDKRASMGGKQREQLIPCEIEVCPPDNRWYDALNSHYRLKAMQDGVADALGVSDARFWPTTLKLGDAVKNGKVIMRIGE